MAIYRAGKLSIWLVESENLTGTQYTVKRTGDNVDVSNFETNGFRLSLLGLQGGDWSGGGIWNADNNPYADPPGLYPRDDGTDMIFMPSSLGAANVTFPVWACWDSEISTSVSGAVQFQASGTSQGVF